MSLPIQVEAYSGYKANECPLSFDLDEQSYQIASVVDRWQDPEAEYFKVRTTDGKLYLLRYNERTDEWTLQGGFDGDELLARPGIELISVDAKAIREAESRIVGCQRCHADEADLPFDRILAEVLGKAEPIEFVMVEAARCPICRQEIMEKTLVVPL